MKTPTSLWTRLIGLGTGAGKRGLKPSDLPDPPCDPKPPGDPEPVRPVHPSCQTGPDLRAIDRLLRTKRERR
jgi:hypothetical protein